MFQILSNTPIYAWILLALLVWKGLRARKIHIISWKDMLVFPLVMLGWSFYSAYQNYDVTSLLFWILSLAAGIAMGPLTMRGQSFRFDKEKKQVELSGSWVPLVLMLSIFAVRYYLGASYGMHPELKGALSLFTVECLAALIAGIFFGRFLGLWRRSKQAPHVDLVA